MLQMEKETVTKILSDLFYVFRILHSYIILYTFVE